MEPTPATPTEADPPPSPWLRQLWVNVKFVCTNLIYSFQAATVWLLSVAGILAGAEIAWPDLIGHPYDKIIVLGLSILGPIAKLIPQDIPKATKKDTT